MPIYGQTPRSAPTVRYDLKEILTYATCRGRPMCLPITKKEKTPCQHLHNDG